MIYNPPRLDKNLLANLIINSKSDIYNPPRLDKNEYKESRHDLRKKDLQSSKVR